MGRPYSQDLRERVVDTAGATSRRKTAKRFGVGAATAVRWMTALATTRDGGGPTARTGARRSGLDPYEAFLHGLIAERDDITPEEMRVRLREEHALRVGLGTTPTPPLQLKPELDTDMQISWQSLTLLPAGMLQSGVIQY